MKRFICYFVVLLIMQIGSNSYSSNPLSFNVKKHSFSDDQKTSPFTKPGILSASAVPNQKNSSVSYTSKAIYLNLTPSSTAIVNSDIFSDSTWNVSTGFGVNFEIGYFLKFNSIKA